MKNRDLLRVLASVCSVWFLAFLGDIAPRATTEYIDLDNNGRNESTTTIALVGDGIGLPLKFSSKVTNKAVGFAFAFDWKSISPGGFSGELPPGTSAGVSLKWTWQTGSAVSTFVGDTCDDDFCILPDNREVPLGPFGAPGRETVFNRVSLSEASLNTVVLKAFSPFFLLANPHELRIHNRIRTDEEDEEIEENEHVAAPGETETTIVNATSSVEQLASGLFRYKTLVSNLTNDEIEARTRLLPLVYPDVLGSAQGDEWDTLSIPLNIPAGQTSLTVQVLSRDDLASGDLPASLSWVGAVLAISPPPAAIASPSTPSVAGTETLAPASVPIALGTGVAAGGVGLIAAQPAPLSVAVPAGAAVRQVLLFWEGQSLAPAPGDNTIVVNGNLVTGTLIGGPTVFYQQGGSGGPGVQSSSFRADISSLGLVHGGTNTLIVGGLDFGVANNGAGILVIYDDGTARADIQVREGLDLAYFQFAPPLDTTVPQTYTFAPSADDRTARLVLFVGSVQGPLSGSGPRPNSVQISSETFPPPAPRVIQPGDTSTECTTSRHPAREINDRLELCGDGIPGPPGGCLGGLHPTAHGTFNLLQPDPSQTVGKVFLTPYKVTVSDPPPGGNGDGLLEPGETAGLTIEILNAGPMSVLTAGSASAILTSPPADVTNDGTSNAIAVSLPVDSSPYPDIVGFVPTEPPGAPCLLAARAPLAPSANARPFVVTIPQSHPRDVARPFTLKVTGRLADSSPVIKNIPLNIGIGSGCDPAAVPETCDDEDPGTVDRCVACTDNCNLLGGLCVNVPPGSAPCTGTIGNFVWNDTNQDGVQNAGEPGIPDVRVVMRRPGAFGGVTPGALSSRAGEGYKFGSVFPLSQASTPASFSFYTAGGGAAQKFTPVIYTADALGNPLSLVAMGAEVTVGAAQPAGWVQSALPPVPLAPGNYLLGLLSGPAADGALNFYDAVPNAGVYNTNPYPTPSSSWGTINREDRRWSFSVAFEARATTITSSDGSYFLADLCAGSYSVFVDGSTLPAGFVASPCNAGSDDAIDNDCSPVDVALASDLATNLTIDFGYHAPAAPCTGAIGDFVWNDLDQDGVQDAGEPGINGVILRLKNAGGSVIASVKTDGSGLYAFADLCAGSYTVEVNATTLPTGFIPSPCDVGTDTLDNDCSPEPVTLPADSATNRTIDFGYHRCTGKIGDFVWNDTDRDGDQDANEPGINGVVVRLKNPAGSVIASTTTNGSGLYQFSDLCAGSYTVEVDATSLPADFIPSPCDAGNDTRDNDCSPEPVTLPISSTTNTTIDFGFNSPCTGVIGDFVWNDTNRDDDGDDHDGDDHNDDGDDHNGIQEAGEPGLSGVEVRLKNAAGTLISSTTTNGSGIYQFAGLCAGTYTVEVNAATLPTGFVPSSCNVGDDGDNGGGDDDGDDHNDGDDHDGDGGDAVDNDCSPATVILPDNNTSNLTIDFGFYSPHMRICPNNDPTGSPIASLATTVDGNGDVTVLLEQNRDNANDNSYGENSVNWGGRTRTFHDLVSSDKAQFKFKNASGAVVLDISVDYISVKAGTPSGYGTLGVSGGEGRVNSGNAAWLLAVETSLDKSLNDRGFCTNGNCVFMETDVRVNSPPANSSYITANTAFKAWNFTNSYMVKVSHLAFGSSGFGSVDIAGIQNSPSKGFSGRGVPCRTDEPGG